MKLEKIKSTHVTALTMKNRKKCHLTDGLAGDQTEWRNGFM